MNIRGETSVSDPIYLPILVAHATQTKAGASVTPTAAFCKDVDNISIGELQLGREWYSASANNDITPLIVGELYKRTGIKLSDVSSVGILEQPKHGKLYPYPNAKNVWAYISEPGFKGHDRVVFQVDGNGKKVRVVVNLLVGITDENNPSHCKDEKFEPVNKHNDLKQQGPSKSWSDLHTGVNGVRHNAVHLTITGVQS